ncbi:FIST signal transduction protein [Halobaculum sp. MBLA0143]|uniref:FIST signal transduction protein n=1 Tax=Halobaculum sp. MBLA0143 TaxID=3079933 RepID=UPI003523A0B2
MRQEHTTGDETVVRAVAERVAAEEGVRGLFVLVGAAAPAGVEALAPDQWSVDVPVVGGVFPEVIRAGERTDTATVVVGLPVAPEIQTVTGLSDETAEIRSQLDPTVPERGHETAFVLVDSHADRVGAFVDRLFDTYGVEVTFVGGGAGPLSEPDGPSLFTGAGPVTDGAVVAATPLSSSVGVHHGWQEIAGPFRVTESDGRTVRTLDSEPAFERYCEVVADDAGQTPTREEFFETAKAYPFGISRVGAETVVRDPYAVGDDGSVDCFGSVPEGEFVHVLHGEPDRLVAAARQARDDASDGAGDDDTLWFFDCISRVLFLEDDFSRELAAIGDDGEPPVGALTVGEIANDGHGHLEYYNKTAVVASVDES